MAEAGRESVGGPAWPRDEARHALRLLATWGGPTAGRHLQGCGHGGAPGVCGVGGFCASQTGGPGTAAGLLGCTASPTTSFMGREIGAAGWSSWPTSTTARAAVSCREDSCAHRLRLRFGVQIGEGSSARPGSGARHQVHGLHALGESRRLEPSPCGVRRMRRSRDEICEPIGPTPGCEALAGNESGTSGEGVSG
jgi:hypothetical protein